MAEVEQNYKRTIRKVTYRGLDLDRVLRAADADVRRAAAWPLTRCLRRKRDWPLKWLREAKKHVLPLERREVVTTHPRELIILPRTPDSMMGVYSRETFSLVGIKPEDWPLPRRALHPLQARKARRARRAATPSSRSLPLQ